MKTTLKFFAALLVTLVTFTSCSDSRKNDSGSDNDENKAMSVDDREALNCKLLETVSFDANWLAVIDFEQLLNEGLANIDSDPQSKLALIKELQEIANLNSVVVVEPANGDKYVTFEVNSSEIENFVTSNGYVATESRDGYDIYYSQDNSEDAFMVKDSQAWITESPASVIADVKAASKRHFGQDIGLLQALKAGNTVNVAFKSGEIPAELVSDKSNTNGWMVANVLVDGQTVEGDVKLIESSGAPVEIPGLQPVSPAFLSYVKNQPAVAGAIGVTSKFWTTLRSILPTNDEDLTTMLGLMSMIDGTVAFAGTPDFNTPNIEAMVMFEPAKSDAESMVQLALSQFKNYTKMEDGVYRVSMPQLPSRVAYLANVNGKLFFGTYPPSEGNGNNDFAPIFEGKDGALAFDIPKNMMQSFKSRCDFGVKGQVQLSSSSAQFKVTFTDTDLSVIEIIKDLD